MTFFETVANDGLPYKGARSYAAKITSLAWDFSKMHPYGFASQE